MLNVVSTRETIRLLFAEHFSRANILFACAHVISIVFFFAVRKYVWFWCDFFGSQTNAVVQAVKNCL